MTEIELLYTLALQKAPGIGEITAKKLLYHCKSAYNVFHEKHHILAKIDGVGERVLKALNTTEHHKKAEKELRFIQKHDIAFWYYTAEHYPEKLRHCVDAPILLFNRGKIALNKPKIISIVGTRKATNYGIAFCENLIAELAVFNPIIVSGLAYGIDITAHKAAIKNSLQTVACLAHGLTQVYPKKHEQYLQQMEKHGGCISDFWSNDTFDRNNFLKRNRLIAGLSDATIVIESAAKGGSLVTADIANSYNREVFAVPGRTSDSQSQGCINLVKRQQAHLLTSAADLIYMLNWNIDVMKQKTIQKQLFVHLDENEQKVYDYLDKEGKTLLDIIALHCDIPVFKTASLLLKMELKGLIRPLPGKLFEAI